MSARTPRRGSRAVRLFPYVPAPVTDGALALGTIRTSGRPRTGPTGIGGTGDRRAGKRSANGRTPGREGTVRSREHGGALHGPAGSRRTATGPPPPSPRPPAPASKIPRQGPPAGRAPAVRRGPAAGGEEPQLRIAAEATVRVIAEVLAGIRPLRHLDKLASPQVCGELAAIAPAMTARGPVRAPRVLASWLQRPAPQAAEAGAVVAVAGRVQALALRLERRRGRWRCTVLETTAARR